jgi:tetratricopeptide (TPR) repeat protein
VATRALTAPVALQQAGGSELEGEEASEDAESDDEATGRTSRSVDSRVAAANRHVAAGTRALRKNRLSEAQAAYSRALAALSGYPRALAGLVRVHLQRKDGRAALDWARKLVAKQPNRGGNQLLLGDAHALRGDRELALAAWKRARGYGSAAAKKRLQPR